MQAVLRAQVHHEEKCWLILTDCSNDFTNRRARSRSGYLRTGTHTVRP